MKIYLIRHGQTEWNVAHRLQGSNDIPLNELGKWQAERLAEAMAVRPVTKIFSSPLMRAQATARAIAAKQKAPVIVVPELTEISYGIWEGKTSEEILKYDGGKRFKKWLGCPGATAPKGGENLAQVYARCETAWSFIRKNLTGDSAIVFHGGTLACFISLLLEDESLTESFIAENASITTLEYNSETGKCALIEANNDRHLH